VGAGLDFDGAVARAARTNFLTDQPVVGVDHELGGDRGAVGTGLQATDASDRATQAACDSSCWTLTWTASPLWTKARRLASTGCGRRSRPLDPGSSAMNLLRRRRTSSAGGQGFPVRGRIARIGEISCRDHQQLLHAAARPTKRCPQLGRHPPAALADRIRGRIVASSALAWLPRTGPSSLGPYQLQQQVVQRGDHPGVVLTDGPTPVDQNPQQRQLGVIDDRAGRWSGCRPARPSARRWRRCCGPTQW
jgi:hypothetical protein